MSDRIDLHCRSSAASVLAWGANGNVLLRRFGTLEILSHGLGVYSYAYSY